MHVLVLLVGEERVARPVVDRGDAERGELGHVGPAELRRDLASHGLDLYRFLIADIDRVYAISRQTPASAEVEDLGAWIVESDANPAFGILESDWPTPGADYGWSVHASSGAAYADYERPGIRYRLKGEKEWSVIDLPKTAVSDRFTRAISDFLQCIDSGATPMATGRDGLRSLEIIEAAYRSVEEGCAVDCKG